MKLVAYIVGILFLSALASQVLNVWKVNRTLTADLQTTTGVVTDLRAENEKVQADLEYLDLPANLEKELRSKFDYKYPGEKLIKIR